MADGRHFVKALNRHYLRDLSQKLSNWAQLHATNLIRSFMLLTVILIIISFPSPTHSFSPGLKPSFYANPSHRSLSFSSSGLTTWIPQTFTVTSEHIRFYFLVFLFYTF